MTMATKQSLLALLAAAAACLLLLPAASAVTDVEYCNKGKNYPVKVSSVEIVPDPVERGVPATFKISASTDKNITEGKLVIDVKYWIFNVYSETDDICTKTKCPGSYTIQMKMLGKHDEELSCISFGFNIGFLAPVALS